MSLMETRKADIEHHLSKYPDNLSAVMPLLYIAQEEYGYITDEAVAEIADIIDSDVTHIKGIIGFYMMYFDKPIGKNILYICTDLPCALKGAEEFSQQVCQHLNVEPGNTTEDGMFYVENVMCVGACDRVQVMQLNFRFHENMDFEKATDLIAKVRAGDEVYGAKTG